MAPPAVGSTFCDPAFGTAVSRITPDGYSLFHARPFSANGGWVLTIDQFGGQTAFKLKPNGQPEMRNGQPYRVDFVPEMLPHSPNGRHCGPTGSFWSTREEGVIYLTGCGTQIFKYDLNAYDPLRPMAALRQGTGRFSKARWPIACLQPCRQGPVFVDLSEEFGVLADYGARAVLRASVSNDDLTFAGCIFREGYKNCQAMFALRPSTGQYWRAAGTPGIPDPFFLYRGAYRGQAVNQRILDAKPDASGDFVGIGTCSDVPASYDGCERGGTYVVDLRATPDGPSLDRAPSMAVDFASHGYWMSGQIIGPVNSQQVSVNYFEGAENQRTLREPDFRSPNWWSSYTTGAMDVEGPGRRPWVGGISTYSVETNPLSACPSRNCLYANEVLLYNLSGTHFLRVAQNRSFIPEFRSPSSYWDLPRVGVSNDGRLVTFNSNWGRPSVEGGPQTRAVYVVRVPASWPYMLDDTSTMLPARTTATANSYLEFTFSHLKSSPGAEVLIQDRTLSGPSKIRGCYFRLSMNGTIQLADDNGIFDPRSVAPLVNVFPQPPLENSQCRIATAQSGVNPTNASANMEYRVRILFKEAWIGKNLRVVMANTSMPRWQDVGQIDLPVASSNGWVTVPGSSPVTVLPNTISASGPGSSTIWHLRRLTVGQSFELQVGSTDPDFSVGLTSSVPASPSQHLGFSVATFASVGGQTYLGVAENQGANLMAVQSGIRVGDTLRIANVNGSLVYSLNGAVIASSPRAAPSELVVSLSFGSRGGLVRNWVLR